MKRRGNKKRGSGIDASLSLFRTFPFHLPEVILSSYCVAASAEGIDNGVINLLCWPHLRPLHPVHGIEYDVVVAVNPVRSLSNVQEIFSSFSRELWTASSG